MPILDLSGSVSAVSTVSGSFGIELVAAINSVDDLEFRTHNLNWVENIRAGMVGWESLDEINPILIIYGDDIYEITEGYTDKDYLYWDFNGTTTVFVGTDVLEDVNTDGRFPLAKTDSGKVDATWGLRIIYNQKLVANADGMSEGDTNKFAAESGADITGDHEADIALANLGEKSIDSLVDSATYKKFLGTEKTKLTGVEALADVTSTHEAATIASQGALATLATVDTAQIDNVAITRPKIADDSTWIGGMAYTAAEAGFIDVEPNVDSAQELTFTTLGAMMQWWMLIRVHNYNASTRNIKFRWLRWDTDHWVIATEMGIGTIAGSTYKDMSWLGVSLYGAAEYLWALGVSCMEDNSSLKVSMRRMQILEWAGK